MEISEDTPIALLTVGQFMDLQQVKDEKVIIEKEPNPNKKYVYGLKGIQELFGVSHVTAQHYKDGILRDAVIQNGRVIMTDVDKALELFKNNK